MKPLKYNYKEGQWSPLNLEGTKEYDRDFLLSLQDQASSRVRPDNLPDLPDVILRQSGTDEQQPSKAMPSGPSLDYFTPGYVKTKQLKDGFQFDDFSELRRDMKPQRVIEIPVQPPVKLQKIAVRNQVQNIDTTENVQLVRGESGWNRFSAFGGGGTDPRGRGTGRGAAPGRPQDSRGRPQPRDAWGWSRSSHEESERGLAFATLRYCGVRADTPLRRVVDNHFSYLDTSPRRPVVETKFIELSRRSLKQLNEDDMEYYTEAILNHLLYRDEDDEDIEDADFTRYISVLDGQKLMNVFVKQCYNQHVLKRCYTTESDRKLTASLLRECIKRNYLQRKVWIQGTRAVTESAEDLEMDVPEIWQHLAELIGPMMEDGFIPLRHLSRLCAAIQSINKRGRLAVAVLKYISDSEGHGEAGRLWRRSGLKWTKFVDYQRGDLDKFIKDNNLEYTIAELVEAHPDDSLSFEAIQQQLCALVERDAPNGAIFDWIESNVSKTRCKETKFIRALMTVVCVDALRVITGSTASPLIKYGKTESLEPRAHVLRKYIDHDPLLEVQALYVLQALVHELEHPSGLLEKFFEELDDLKIVSQEAFNVWMNGSDPNEQKGFVAAKRSVNAFLGFLLYEDDKPKDS